MEIGGRSFSGFVHASKRRLFYTVVAQLDGSKTGKTNNSEDELTEFSSQRVTSGVPVIVVSSDDNDPSTLPKSQPKDRYPHLDYHIEDWYEYDKEFEDRSSIDTPVALVSRLAFAELSFEDTLRACGKDRHVPSSRLAQKIEDRGGDCPATAKSSAFTASGRLRVQARHGIVQSGWENKPKCGLIASEFVTHWNRSFIALRSKCTRS
ncbi:hypothetical protein DFJ77DRAFT_437031 [Powellomyces hirtus]|nr:hypothetical protein DFJ77DRAFT_437031 [Powellomyces hirtus]